MPPLRPVPVSALLLAAAVLTACGGGSSSSTASDPAGAVTADDLERAVLAALEGQVTVTIDGDTATLDNGHRGLVVSVGPRQG